MNNIRAMLDALMMGEDIVDNYVLNSFVLGVLQGQYDTDNEDIRYTIIDVIKICNILYNNTDRSILPLEDGIYDMLVVLATNLGLSGIVGAVPTNIEIRKPVLMKPFNKINLKQPFIKLDSNKVENMMFHDDLIYCPDYIPEQFYPRAFISTDLIKKKTLNIPHQYPKLVGTLDKCKFVLDHQAEQRGVLNDANVSVFERDFLRPHMVAGIIDPNHIRLLVSLKMDGVSVEATVSDRIISARSRGDTDNDIATDLTPALRGYKFPKSPFTAPDMEFGMKFECMLSTSAMQSLGAIRGVDYANPRNAIIGLLGARDCNQWLEYITLIPLETSLDLDPVAEIEMMNAYYAKEPLRYTIIEGNYASVLFQLKTFVEEAEYIRPIMPYIYDGVVVSYIDKDIREKLGRVNSVNKYSIAIKFNPEKKYTRFIGYTYSIGQNGVVTPIAHYNPVELFGAIHQKTSAHSFARFKELGLRENDVVEIELINDVIPYISKASVEENQSNNNPIIAFPSHCPCCGSPLEFTEKTAYCPNKECPDRRLSITTNMFAKLGFKDFSEETLRVLTSIRSFTDLVNVATYGNPQLELLGPVEQANFLARLNELLNSEMWDYRLIGSIGFQDISDKRWQIILQNISIDEIADLPASELYTKLISIKGIGDSIASVILSDRADLYKDLNTIRSMKYKSSFGYQSKLQIRFTGVRDNQLMEQLANMGYDCTGGGVTKSTNILLVPYVPYSSSKTSKISPDCKVIAIDDFKQNMQRYLV